MKTTSSNRLFQIVISCLTLTLLLWCGNARAQITLQDGTLQPAVTTTSPVSMSFTSTVGANSVLVVSVFSRDNNASETLPATLPWGTQTLTKAVSVNGAGSTWAWCDIYYLFNPNAETHTISVSDTLNTGSPGLDLQVYTLSGVDPNVAPMTYKINNGGATSLLIALPASIAPGLAVVNSSYGTANLVMNVTATAGTVNCWETNNAISADMGYVNGIPATGASITANSGGSSQKMGLAIVFFTQLGAGPAAPGNFTATPTAHQVNLSWNASAGATSYVVWRATGSGGFSSIATNNGNGNTSYPDTTVSPYTQFYYYVQGVNGSGGGGFSLEASAFPEWATGVIGVLDGSLNGGQVDWSTNNDTVFGETISDTFTVSSGASVLIVNLYDQITNSSATISSDWTPSTLSWGTQTLTKAVGQFNSRPTSVCDTYYLFNPTPGTQTISYADGSGNPVWCQDMQAYTLHDVDTTVTPATYGSAGGFVNLDQINTLSAGTPSGAFATVCGESGDNPAYVVSSSGTTNYVTSPGHTSVPAFAHQIVMMGGVPGLAAGTGSIWVTNASGGGQSATLANVVFTAYIPPSAPATPTGVMATGQTNQILVNWNSSANATAYVILRSATSGSGYLPVGTNNGVASTNYTDTAVANYTTYYYVVKARNINGDSALSSPEASANAVGVPAAPTGLMALWGNSMVTLNWNTQVGADSWNVLRSTTSGSETTVANSTTPGYVDSPVANFTKYYYVLAASNSFGIGPTSAEVSVIPAVPLTNWIGVFNSVADIANWHNTISNAGFGGGYATFYPDAPAGGPSTGCLLFSNVFYTGVLDGWDGISGTFNNLNESNATMLEFDVKVEGDYDSGNGIQALQPTVESTSANGNLGYQWGGSLNTSTSNQWLHVVIPISGDDAGNVANWTFINDINLNVVDGYYPTPTMVILGYANFEFTGAPGYAPVFSGLANPASIPAGTPSVTLTGTVSGGYNNYLANGTPISVTINGSTQNTTVNDTAGDFSISFTGTGGLLPASYPITYVSASDYQIFIGGTNNATSLLVTSAAPPPPYIPAPTLNAAGTSLLVTPGGNTASGSTYYLLQTTSLNPPVVWTTNTSFAGTGAPLTNSVPLNSAKDIFLEYEITTP